MAAMALNNKKEGLTKKQTLIFHLINKIDYLPESGTTTSTVSITTSEYDFINLKM